MPPVLVVALVPVLLFAAVLVHAATRPGDDAGPRGWARFERDFWAYVEEHGADRAPRR